MLSNYKKWTGKEREASYKITKKAMKDGTLPMPTKCNRCGQTEGRIDYHSENYDDPINGLESICMKCHLCLHREYNKSLKKDEFKGLKINCMTPKQLIKKVKLMELEAPLTKKFEKALFDIGRWNYEREAKKYSDQKNHWIGWLSDQDGPGAYNRKNFKNRTARIVYNQLACPPMLFWLCEKSGVQRQKLLLARRRALEANPAYSSMCSAIRGVIPWELVAECLLKIK